MNLKELRKEMMALEDELKILIKELGVVEFARRAEINYIDVSRWHSGHRKWSYEKMLRIAEKLEV